MCKKMLLTVSDIKVRKAKRMRGEIYQRISLRKCYFTYVNLGVYLVIFSEIEK